MTDERERLLACPLCAGKAWRGGYSVQCEDCGCQVLNKSQALADAAWNRRAPAVPEGWRLVPVNPTNEMVDSVRWVASGWVQGKKHALETWRLMLAAAPQPKEPADGD